MVGMSTQTRKPRRTLQSDWRAFVARHPLALPTLQLLAVAAGVLVTMAVLVDLAVESLPRI